MGEVRRTFMVELGEERDASNSRCVSSAFKILGQKCQCAKDDEHRRFHMGACKTHFPTVLRAIHNVGTGRAYEWHHDCNIVSLKGDKRPLNRARVQNEDLVFSHSIQMQDDDITTAKMIQKETLRHESGGAPGNDSLARRSEAMVEYSTSQALGGCGHGALSTLSTSSIPMHLNMSQAFKGLSKCVGSEDGQQTTFVDSIRPKQICLLSSC
ncbi:hypothetical protein BO94DRAFT_549077 [Aspergillus sclerotioniger CBS 115572]|uniref:Uncharacterized protein n=1 Tax=Aspergillus sclerotioniger CBS 115572 TaxID=1450535 RepID=A0A317VSG5_9EURO|nr:hypothetical protein BO94DRAFT_549077 [Aspergillus sclerotioniger CBS 115572]PWY77263.1 hypothetical protein BO94DRAFT_549077 [Aspergillus sclerotioniger CBS 115572]